MPETESMDNIVEIGNLMAKTLMDEGILPTTIRDSYYKIISNTHAEFIYEIDSLRKIEILLVKTESPAITVEDVVSINTEAQKIFEEDGVYGIYGLKEPGQIEYALDRVYNSTVFGQDLLPTPMKKAAFLWHRLAKNQSFQNGNKRTALLVQSMFLYLNYIGLRYTKKLSDLYEDVSIKISVNELNEEGIYRFYQKYAFYDFDRAADVYIKMLKRKLID